MAIGVRIKMADDKKTSDLEEDEELAALRMAALATIKSRSAKKAEYATDRNHASAISSIVTPSNAVQSSSRIPFIQTDRPYSSYNGHNTWRKHNQSSRRRGGSFSKSSQRSNLIVISPVSLDDKKPSEEKSTPPLILPQYKWSNSGNEDSLSPKSYRRTGPTRFNRHESGSDSSESDMDYSDNDSCSNETVLQDEPSDRFSHLSPEESNNNESDIISESEKQRNSDRRLSFHNLDSDIMHDPSHKNETTSVYNCLKNNYSYDSPEKRSDAIYKSMQSPNDALHTNVQSEDTYNKYSAQSSEEEKCPVEQSDSYKSCSEKDISFESNVEHAKTEYASQNCTVNQEISEKSIWKSSETQSDHTLLNKDITCISKDSHSHLESSHKLSTHSETKMHSLSQNDLRFELKKRVYDSNSKRLGSSSRQNQHYDNLVNNYTEQSKRTHDRHRRLVRSRSRDNSREQTKRMRHHRSRASSSHSRSSSSSSTSSSSSSSSNSSPTVRSVPSVIKPVNFNISNSVKSESKSHSKAPIKKSQFSSSETDYNSLMSTNIKDTDDSYKCPTSKVSVASSDSQNNASESTKRMPVHMRLGNFPRKRIIQMTKDVEAAFVNSSSDDDTDVNIKCKKQNLRIVTQMCGSNSDEKIDKSHTGKESPGKRSENSREWSRRLKTHR